MSNPNPVLTRLPGEIWRIILLEATHPSYSLDTTYEWSLFKLWSATAKGTPAPRLQVLEALSRHKRFPVRAVGSRDPHEEPHLFAHARKAHVCASLRHMFTTPTLWEVVENDYSNLHVVGEFLSGVGQGYNLRLRRLCGWTYPSSHASLLSFPSLHFCSLEFPGGPFAAACHNSQIALS
jgi:hypothetical protein